NARGLFSRLRSRHDEKASRNHHRLRSGGPNEEEGNLDADAHARRLTLVHRSRRRGPANGRGQTPRTVGRAAQRRRFIPRHFANFQIGFGAMNLPRTWQTMSLDALYWALNDPGATAQVTVEAIMYAVRERGIPALEEPDTIARLRQCDEDARLQIKQRIKKLG